MLVGEEGEKLGVVGQDLVHVLCQAQLLETERAQKEILHDRRRVLVSTEIVLYGDRDHLDDLILHFFRAQVPELDMDLRLE